MSTRKARRGAPPPEVDPGIPSPILFRSDRSATLRFAALVCAVPVPLTIWLLTLPAPGGWDDSPLGPTWGWLIPTALLALSAVLPAAMCLLHGRYVLLLERAEGGSVRVTTWLLWGQRTEDCGRGELTGSAVVAHEGRFESMWAPSVNAPYLLARLPSGRRLILDQQGDAPRGWNEVYGVFRLQRPRGA